MSGWTLAKLAADIDDSWGDDRERFLEARSRGPESETFDLPAFAARSGLDVGATDPRLVAKRLLYLCVEKFIYDCEPDAAAYGNLRVYAYERVVWDDRRFFRTRGYHIVGGRAGGEFCKEWRGDSDSEPEPDVIPPDWDSVGERTSDLFW